MCPFSSYYVLLSKICDFDSPGWYCTLYQVRSKSRDLLSADSVAIPVPMASRRWLAFDDESKLDVIEYLIKCINIGKQQTLQALPRFKAIINGFWQVR